MKRKLPLSCLFALLFSASGAFAQNPTAPALGFNVFAQAGTNLINNETEGPVAVGGDLTIAGTYNVSTVAPGGFTRHGIPVSLVVGGRVNYGTGLLTVNQNGYVKIGDCTGSAVWYTDMSGAHSAIHVTSASDYSATPRINMVVTAADLGVSGSVNPVNESGVIDFPSAFALMQSNAANLSLLNDNADLTDSIGNVLSSHTGLPGNVVVNLHSGTNILNISGSDLNNLHLLAYGNSPDAGHILVINVDAPGAFTWNVCEQHGAGLTESSYILYNFHNCSSLNISGSGAIEGTVFAPSCDVNKTTNSSVIEGQVICHSFHHGAGSCHHAPFHPEVGGCGGSINTVASYDVCSYNECLSNNVFIFNGSAVGVGPFTYHWNFDDGTTSTAKNVVKTYTATGTYHVWFTATGAGGTDSVMHTIVVNPDPVHGFIVNDSIQALAGNNFMLTSRTPTTGNTYYWSFADGTHSTAPNPTKIYTHVGDYIVSQQVTRPGGCTFTSYMKVFVTCDSVDGGGGGGLESVSLGDLVSRRVISKYKNSVDKKTDYNKMAVFHKGGNAAARGTAGSGNSIQRFTPATLEGSNTTPKISTPTDITSLTSAVDVFAVDYENNNNAKAVVLAMTTLGKAYNHTKSICDRFRGATLLSTDMVTIDGYKFIQFSLQQQNGTIEYAISFAAGKSAGNSHFNLQSKWLISEYAGYDSVFNFQVWAASPEHTQQLTKEILTNLGNVLPVQQVEPSLVLPPAYIASGKRDKGFLNLAITTTATTANSKIIFEEKKNENSGVDTLMIPFTVVPGSANNFKVPIYDGYEYQGHLYVNDTLVDDIYMADGNWSLDADPGANMKPDNNFSRVYADGEYPLYRNVTLSTTSPIGYASVWKFITSGEEKVNLTDYHSFKFLAKGAGKVRVTLVKDGITNWNDQYYTTIELDPTGNKNYQISFDDFTSDNIGSPFNPIDVTAVVYTFKSETAANVNFFADEQSFSPTVVQSVKAIHSKRLTISPNPANGPFQCRFGADQDRDLTLELTDISGRIAYRQAIHAVMGINTVTVNVPAELNGAMFILKLGNSSVKYDVTKVSLLH